MINTKGQYAQHRGVTAGRVSQWLSAGWLDDALVDGVGNPAERSDRSARIDFEKADAALRQYLNVGQVMGQGRALPPPPEAQQPEPRTSFAPSPSPLITPINDAAARLQEAKAIQAEIETTRQLRKQLEERGIYTLTYVARTEFSRRLSDLVSAIDSWLPDLTSAISAHLVEGGANDVKTLQVLARDKWREFRGQRAKLAAAAGHATNPFISDPEETAP